MMKKLSQQNQVKLHDMLIDMQHEFGVSVIASVCDTCGLVLGPKDGKGLAGVSHGGIAWKKRFDVL